VRVSVDIVCVPVTADGQVAPGWGRAPVVALATVTDGQVTDWRVVEVGWDVSHETGTEGSHHARVVRFLRENDVTAVRAQHMGEPMQNTLRKLGVDVRLGAAGDARAAVTSP
jgi:predicted Fe-Mo cluster-binding NifX family protein